MNREEIDKLFNSLTNKKHKAIFELIYGSGLKISEAANIKVQDINSKEMKVYVKDAKGHKDRYTIKELESDIKSENNKEHIKNKCPFCKSGTLIVVKKILFHRAIL